MSYELLRSAIQKKQQVRCMYKGRYREVCLHVIGTKNGRENVLAFQFAGESSSGLPPDGEWRCMLVDEISDIKVVDGKWHSRDNHSRPQTCVDVIDLEVDH
jgi:hypothetical protein